MNGTRASLDQIKAIAEGVRPPLADKVEALICPPATLLYVATALCTDSPLSIGAQDCHQKASGAHTGDISAEMIADSFGTYVIVGHSERRTDHAETDHLVRAKAEAAFAAGLTAIICIGETADERRAGQALDIIKRQLSASVPDGATAENTVRATWKRRMPSCAPKWRRASATRAARCAFSMAARSSRPMPAN
jgi:triosephosphate isomerase